MKNNKVVWILVSGLLALASVAVGICVDTGLARTEEAAVQAEKESVRTFKDWTEEEAFHSVPVFLAKKGRIGEVTDDGDGIFTITVDGNTLDEYRQYIELLEANGYTKYADNGESGINEDVYHTTLTKEHQVLQVSYMSRVKKSYITVAEDMPLSEHLLYQDAYVANQIDGAKTTLYMMELYGNGNSFVIQLKNGHFILNDGGTRNDAPYLFDFIESLVPEGEIPVIEAWFISHSHTDHSGVLAKIGEETQLAKRFYVEGVYFTKPSLKIIEEASAATAVELRQQEMGCNFLKNSNGETPNVYRMQTGQKYYFNDVVVDILLTTDMVPSENFTLQGNINETSTCLMYNIENQKFLLSGDSDFGANRTVERFYSPEYLDVDIMGVFHHGANVHTEFIECYKAETLLYPYVGARGLRYLDEYTVNEELQKAAVEYYHYGNGTKMLTFPYKIGTAKSLPMLDWKYNEDLSDRTGVNYKLSDNAILYNPDGSVKNPEDQ